MNLNEYYYNFIFNARKTRPIHSPLRPRDILSTNDEDKIDFRTIEYDDAKGRDEKKTNI